MPYNEEALNDAYNDFRRGGYTDTREDFFKLLASDKDAFGDAYKSFTSQGYNGNGQDFAELLGLKEVVTKKEEVKKEEPKAEEVKKEQPLTFKTSKDRLNYNMEMNKILDDKSLSTEEKQKNIAALTSKTKEEGVITPTVAKKEVKKPKQEQEVDEISSAASVDGLLNYFTNIEKGFADDFAGVEFDKGGLGAKYGDVVATFPDGETFNVNVGDKESIQQVLNYRKTYNSKGQNDWIELFGDDVSSDEAIEEFNNLFKDNDKGYTFGKGRTNIFSREATVKKLLSGELIVKDKNGNEVAHGKADVLKFLSKNLSDADKAKVMTNADTSVAAYDNDSQIKELQKQLPNVDPEQKEKIEKAIQVLEDNKKLIGGHKFDALQKAQDVVDGMTNKDLYNENLENGVVAKDYVSAGIENGMSEDDAEKFEAWLNAPITKEIRVSDPKMVSGYHIEETEVDNWRGLKLTDFSELQSILSPDGWDKVQEVKNQRQELNEAGLNIDQATAEELRVDKVKEYTKNHLEKKMDDNRWVGPIVQASQFDDQREIENGKDQLENANTLFKEEMDNFSTRIKTEQKSLVNSAKNSGVRSIEYNEASNTYTVTAINENVANEYERKFNNLANKISTNQSVFTETRQKLLTQANNLAITAEDVYLLTAASGKDYRTDNTIYSDISKGFIDIGLNTQVLFGVKGALEKKNKLDQEVAERYKSSLGYKEAFATGQGWEYAGRSITKNAAPMITAIGISAIPGIGQLASGSILGGIYGVSASGEKRAEIENIENAAEAANVALNKLELRKDNMDPKVYEKTKVDLMKTVADADMTETEKWTLIVGTGLIEGTLTAFIGQAPNAYKFVKNIANPVDDLANLALKGNMSATGNFLKSTGKAMLGEQIEENLIYIGTQGLDAKILDKAYDFGDLDETAMQTLFASGPMNSSGNAYSTIMTQVATSPKRAAYKQMISDYKTIDMELGKLDPGDTDQRDILLDARREIQNAQIALTDEMEVDAILMGNENMGKAIRYGTEMQQMDAKAGVDLTLSPKLQAKQRTKYLKTLSEKEANAFERKYNNLAKGKQKAIQKGADGYDNAANKMYGDYGDTILENLIAKDPSLKKADAKDKAIAVHQEFKRRSDERAIGRGRSDQNVVNFVEQQIYGEGGFANAKTKDGKPRQRRNLKAEREMYLNYGRHVARAAGDAVIVSAEENVKASSLIKDKRLEDLDLTVAKDDGQLQEEIMNAYDDMKQQEFDKINRSNLSGEEKINARAKAVAKFDSEATEMINELRSGQTNAFIVGGKYIVKDKKAALAAMAEGNLLAGTALSHEISHAIDAKAFVGKTDKETKANITNYGKNLMNYTSENFGDIHDDAMFRLQHTSDGEGGTLFDSSKPMNEQSDLFWDEYTKAVQDVFRRPSSRSDYQKLLKESQSFPNLLEGVFRGDYNIKSGRDAAVYLGSYIKGFKAGKIGKLQKRKMDAAAETKKKEGLVEARKSENIISPILHDKATDVGKKANNLYAARNSNPDYAFDIAKLYDNMIGKYLTYIENEGAELGRTPDERQKNIDDFKMNAMYSKRGVINMVLNEFDPNLMVDVRNPETGEITQEPNTISKFINGLLPQRLKNEFFKDTTINFEGFDVALDQAAELTTTETSTAIDEILSPEVSQQLETPLLSNLQLNKDQVKVLRDAIYKVVGRRLPALDAVISKNKSITPLIAALKQEFGVKHGDIHKIVYELIGDNKFAVEEFLKNPKNKQAVLSSLTTTWLAKHLPIAVQKEVNGIGWTTDHKGRTKGTKPGQINFWRMAEDGPYKGMTDGKQKIRRNPDAMKDVTPAMLLSMFAKGTTMTDLKRAGLENLSLAMAQELGIETFKADMINDGPLKDLFIGRQELFDRALADNFVEEFVRQTERGVVKRSENPQFAPLIEKEAYGLLKDNVKNYDKGLPFGGLEALLGGYSNDTIGAFIEAGIFDLFDGSVKNGFVIPTENMDWVIGDKTSFIENPINSPEAKAELSKASSVAIDTLPSEILNILPDEFFGIQSRLLDGAAKKEIKGWKEKGLTGDDRYQRNPDGSFVTGEYHWLKKKLDKARQKPISGNLNFDPSGFEMLNSTSGLMGSITTILNKDYSNLSEQEGRQKKIDEIKKRFGERIDNANATNHKVLKYMFTEMSKLIGKNPKLASGFARLMQGATNNVKGFRSATTLDMMKVYAASQAPYLTKDGKPSKNDTLNKGGSINTKHPDYQRAFELSDGDVNKIGELLKYKGEHIDPSANVMQESFTSILELAKLLNGNLKKYHKQIINEHQSKFDDILRNFTQSLGPVVDSDIQDNKLGSTSRIGWARNLSVSDQLNTYANTTDYSGVENLVKEKSIAMLQLIGLQERLNHKRFKNAVAASRAILKSQNPAKGISVLDFDDTLATTKSNVLWTAPDGTKGKLSAKEYASQYQNLLNKGYKFDFSEFRKVVKGKPAPLLNKALKLAGKFGTKDMFILTARPADSAPAIKAFLKANGLDIPLKNITGLGKSTSEAKALWVADKVTEGYNDFYFADDALPNVQAVDSMLNQFDVKRKVQQALRSENPSGEFNQILEQTKGLPADYKISQAKARQRGKRKGNLQFWIPPSADDFAGLLMAFQGKGKQGMEQGAWLKEKLLKPFARGDRDLNAARQRTAEEFKLLRKQFPKVSKKLRKTIPTGDYTYGDAMRVWLWDRAGMEVPGLSKTDKKNMLDLVNGDPELQSFAETLGVISRKEDGYIAPDEYWMTKDIIADITEDGIIGDGRKEHFAEWIENKNIIFSPENLNKIEFLYGSNFREALEDILYRMENGSNRPTGKNRIVNNFLNWLNGGISVVMNWNSRSAVLQTLSTVNFINWGDNNVLKAGKAFANQKQFWTDFAFIFNSDMLKQRRAGLKTTIESNELMSEVEGAVNPVRAAIRYLLRVGFTPTKIADSFAIAMGGSSMYRNRIKTYEKQGYTKQEAEQKAWLDFQEIAEETQQSSRPDRISQQQASVLGRLILAFQNTPMQYMRLTKKEMLDLVNGRYEGVTGPNSFASKIGKITYYAAIQNLIFYSMQNALFGLMFGDEDDEEFFKKKKHRVADNMVDGILRGLGVGGAVVSTIKNMIKVYAVQQKKGWKADESAVLMEGLKLSPPLSIKARQILSADKTMRYNKNVIKEMETFDIDNPMWSAMFNVVEATTNIPAARMQNKYINVRESLNQQHEAWQRIAMFFGWSAWNFGIKNEEVEDVKKEIKQQKTYDRKKKREEEKAKKQVEEQAKINKQVEQEKELEEKGLLKDPKCRYVSTKGTRCKKLVGSAGELCTIHEEVPQRVDGKKTQCKKIKTDGKKCKMQTSNKSGYCYYHD